jgi:hypothetical protein
MKTKSILAFLLAALVGLALGLRAQEDPKPPQPPLDRQQLREQLKNLTPEQRQAKLREMREQQLGTNRVEIEKRREAFQKLQEELKGLPPEERQARMREWREKQGLGRPGFRTIDTDQAKAKREELKKRIDQQLTELRKKKADGTITEQESKRLERMELMSKRLEERDASGTAPGGLPPPVVPPKPAKPPGTP